jgi:hypothetical protein
VSAQATWCRFYYHLDSANLLSLPDSARHDTYTATLGHRFRWSILLFNLAIGGALAHDWNHHGSGYDSLPGPLSNPTSFILDGEAAVGVEF